MSVSFLSNNVTLSNYHLKMIEDAKKKGIDPNTLLLTQRVHSFGISSIVPFGLGADPAFMKLQEKAQKLFQRAMSSQAIQDLYQEALLTPHPFTRETGSWDLIFKKAESGSGLALAGASCNYLERRVTMAEHLTDDEALLLFVFELTNAISSSEFAHAYLSALNGRYDRETYAMKLESIEHQGVLRVQSVMRDAIKEMGWSNSLADEYKDFTDDFNHYLSLTDSQHTDQYRFAWDRIQSQVSALNGKTNN